ncbi:ThiF family adenylyltransferase [Burkholderia ubonensis]|uniref:ThiF family adenylyltransferase n=1 Tax=Burkholderia ubonensis TaxID=101571 RepID=UPI000B28F627|nr:ThiF family adenylyltransferase [Burkholderia ubonensis]
MNTVLQIPLPATSPLPAESVETALENLWPGEWRRLREAELEALRKQFRFAHAWRLDMPRVEHAHPRVDYVLLLIDDVFPLSELRICAPQADGRLHERWPHVEELGLLCLASRPLDRSILDRIQLAVSDAAEVLQMDQEMCRQEFQREFLSYWNREASDIPSWKALFRPAGDSRVVFYAHHGRTLVFGESEDQVVSWLTHSGVPNPPKPSRSWFAMLDEALAPADYPINGRALLDLVGVEHVMPLVDPPNEFPVLLGMPTETGAVFAGVRLRCPDKKKMWKGFRTGAHLPARHIEYCYAGRCVERVKISRADQSWIHGRNHDPVAVELAERSVALIGCGALGGELARLLAQAGVGKFIFVDADNLVPENTSRHLLGAGESGDNKAAAIARRLAKDFPHIRDIYALGCRFEDLSTEQLAEIYGVDLLITAGLFLPTDIRVNKRRLTGDQKPSWLVSWTEELACVGHAVLLVGDADLMDLFDEAGKPKRVMTSQWPPSVGTLAEAGCGNYFQPYGAVDMLRTIGLAARLALDALLGRSAVPTYRIWLGDRTRAAAAGATLSPEFNASMTERAIHWPNP